MGNGLSNPAKPTLNGWQRLFVVLGFSWLVAVGVVASVRWPSARGVPTAQVCSAMPTEAASRLCDCGATCSVRWDWPEGETWGRDLFFQGGTSPADKDRSLQAFGVALEHILTHARAVFVGRALAAWSVPLVALYALGWAGGWVKRGFAQP